MECPLCNSVNAAKKNSYKSNVIANAWEEVFDICIIDQFRGVDHFDLFQCHYCGLLFFTPLSFAGMSNLYQQLQRLPWYYMENKWEHRVAVRNLRKGAQVLEIGSGSGAFVEAATQKGIDASGIETSESAVAAAKQRGIDVSLIELDDIVKESKEVYDAVVVFQVLEHVSDPRVFIEKAIALLKTGGNLIISVPNADSFLKRQFNLLDMPPHHMTRWPLSTLRMFPQFFPLDLTVLKTEPLAKYHVDEYLRANLIEFKQSSLFSGMNAFMARWLSILLRYTGLRKLLVGHTVYATYRVKG